MGQEVILKWFLVTVIFLAIFLLRPSARRERAREYVLDKRTDFARQFTWATSTVAAHPAVREESLKSLGEMKTKFSQIDQLDRSDENVDWIEARRRLVSLQDDLYQIILQMQEEIFSHKDDVVTADQVRLVALRRPIPRALHHE